MQILYRDRWLVAVNKPSGLLVHRSPIDRHESRFALQEVREATGRRVWPLHRLDKPTSGVLLFAFDREIAARLGRSFADGEVRKRYLAVVRGHIFEPGLIDYALNERDPFDNRRKGPSRNAVTFYEPLGLLTLPVAVGSYREARYALVALYPRTGRKHQLRRHMKHIFHPIVGDTTYGKGEHNRLFRRLFGANRLLLHAESLRLIHPVTGKELLITAPMDETMAFVTSFFV